MERPDRTRNNTEVEQENEVEQRPGSKLDVMQTREASTSDGQTQPATDSDATRFTVDISGAGTGSDPEMVPTGSNIAIDHVGAGLTDQPEPSELLLPIEDLDFSVESARSDSQEVIVMDQDLDPEPSRSAGDTLDDASSTNLVLGEDEFMQDQAYASLATDNEELDTIAGDDDDPFDGS
jgi:hypothetical protein